MLLERALVFVRTDRQSGRRSRLVAKYPEIKGPNKNLIREIRRERRVELFAEGYRWDDVCRWNAGEVLYNRERRGARMDPISTQPMKLS